MLIHIIILVVSLFFIVRSALWGTKYSTLLAESFGLSKYIVGLLIVAVISILPETLISVNAVLSGTPELGLGTLFGSNVADLTLVFAIIIAFSGRKNIKIESKILKNNVVYPFIFLIPFFLGFDGHYGYLEGAALIITGLIFYYYAFKNNGDEIPNPRSKGDWKKNIIFLVGSLVILLISSHFTVTSATNLATDTGISPILIGMLVIGIGTVIPELLFSLHAVKKYHDSLAVGDLLGTVLADATIVVGIIALIQPFDFPQRIIYVTGFFMICAAFLLTYFMGTGKVVTRKESILLFLFWILFVVVEYTVGT